MANVLGGTEKGAGQQQAVMADGAISAVTLDDAAKDLGIIDRDLQWYFNSFFLPLVSCSTHLELQEVLE
ncbi:hypothetical protein QFC22_004164 [Naganishia vaughanmartiniae]|uniref:Uncharacterized protein n=1 Tax=Naganishia vaughanmartiniae TaxID=1424756 RepID=A0ACC2X2I8_9TREE|nr:hypothetical protein QFC22_004164 [Naganishia vaughanmartiniae]